MVVMSTVVVVVRLAAATAHAGTQCNVHEEGRGAPPKSAPTPLKSRPAEGCSSTQQPLSQSHKHNNPSHNLTNTREHKSTLGRVHDGSDKLAAPQCCWWQWWHQGCQRPISGPLTIMNPCQAMIMPTWGSFTG